MTIFELTKRSIRCIGLLIVLLHPIGCTQEDLSDCDYYLQFKYDYNMANEDWFGQQVEEVKVFLFDQQGSYVQTLTDEVPALSRSNYKMLIPQHLKGYSAVVWAGRTDSYEIPTLQPGDTKEDLLLHYKPLEMKSDKEIDNLWHNGPTQLIFQDNGGTSQTISLVRNTNDFSIQILDNSGGSLLHSHRIDINSANGSYNHSNTLLPTNLPIVYTPHSVSNNIAQLRTLRLLVDQPITLRITNSEGSPIDIGGQTEINLIEYLLVNKPHEMSDQEYLDRCYIWDLSFTFKDSLALSLKINNWVTWFQKEEI